MLFERRTAEVTATFQLCLIGNGIQEAGLKLNMFSSYLAKEADLARLSLNPVQEILRANRMDRDPFFRCIGVLCFYCFVKIFMVFVRQRP